MTHFVGLDVSVKETSVCVVDDACGPACKRDPLSGVIGVQEGPLISMV